MKTDRKSRTSRKAPFLTSLALACAFMTGNAGAGIPVTDVGNMPNHIITQIQSYLNQINTYTQKGQDLKHMTQQLTDTGQIFNSFQLNFSQNFQKKSLTDGMSDRCGGGTAGMISDLMSSFSLNGDDDIVQQQKIICQRLVMLENQKFNDQVDYLNAIMNQMQSDINKARSQAQNSNTNGKMDSNLVLTTVNKSQMDRDFQLGQERAKTYDAMIEALEKQQKNLATIAMRGKTSVVGTIANTLILKAALKVNE